MKIKILVLFLLALVVYFGSPYWAVYHMTKAAENKNSEALSRYVDYPALRESFKANINGLMANELKNTDNGFEALGVAFGVAMINQMVDALVTPESLAMMLRGENPETVDKDGASTGSPSSKNVGTNISMSYQDLNQFVVQVQAKGSSDEPVKLIYQRYGIVSWKLVGIRLSLAQKSTTSSLEQKVSPEAILQKAEKKKVPLLIPILTDKTFRASNWENGTYDDTIGFTVTLDTSRLNKPTRAVKGVLIFSDLFEEPKYRLNWTINQPLTPGTSYEEKGLGFKYNQFDDGQDWVRNTDLKDMKFQFEVSDILYEDGTRETF